jgi:serine/threonine protein kinase
MTEVRDARDARAGGWRLGRVVSAGALAEVREATSPGGAVAAVKRLHPHSARDPALRALFADECRLTCALPPHPAVVPGLAAGVTGDDDDGGRPYLVMPLIAGRDLRALLEHGGLDTAEVRTVVAAAAAAAAHLHAHGWVHGDLNPANLIVVPGGAVVCDLGVARRAGEAGPVRGTAAYMAPEQVRGEPWTSAVDVFALGVILWELASGARLFHRGASFLSMGAVVEQTAPPLADPALAPIVAAALAKDAAARPSAAELAQSLLVP